MRVAGLSLVGLFQALAAIFVGLTAGRLLSAPGTHGIEAAFSLIAGTAVLYGARILQRRWAEGFALDYVADLRVALISHVMRTSADARPMRSGLVMTRVVNDMSAIKLWLANGLVSLIVAGVVMMTVIAGLAALHPSILPALAPALLLWIACVAVCFRPLNVRIRETRRLRGRIASYAGTILNGKLTLLLHGRHGPVTRSIDRRSRELNGAMIGRATFSGAVRSASDLVFPTIALCLGFGIAGSGVSMDSPEFFGVLMLTAGILITQLNAIGLAVEYRLAHLVAMQRLTEVFQRPTLPLAAGERRLKRRAAGLAIEVQKLEVGPGRRRVSFEVAAGEHVALAGLSAAETTDLFMQICRLTRSGGGRIMVQGQCSGEFHRRDWWRNFCLVSPALAPGGGTVGRNASLGAPSQVPDAERERICGLFGLGPDLLKQPVGEHIPAHTSVAIRAARGVLRKAAVVLVDDGELLANETLLSVFLDELGRAGSSVVIAPGASREILHRCREISLSDIR